MKANSWGGAQIGEVEFQTPVEVISKEIEASSPTLPDLGSLKLGFEISIATKEKADELRKRVGSRCAPGTSIECTVFHYSIRNLSDRPVRNGAFSCSDHSMVPEFRANKDDWRELQSGGVMCTMNVYLERPILPGETAEGDFTLGTLPPQFDTSALYPAGKYEIRVRFYSNACFASPDGSFCIQRPKEQVTITSNVTKIDATAFQPE